MATKTKRESPPQEQWATHSKDGVDLTLIRWMLSFTPAQRLQLLQRNVQSIMRLRAEKSKA